MRRSALSFLVAFLLGSCLAVSHAGVTFRASVATDGTQGSWTSDWPRINPTGRYIAFESYATTLVAGDTNGEKDIFRHDRQTRTTIRVSIKSDGTQADRMSWSAAISSDGRYVAFESYATNLVAGDTNGEYDVFVHDCDTGTTERVSLTNGGGQADKGSFCGGISSDGRYVCFNSYATNLVAGDTNGTMDVFVRDRVGATTTRVSVATGGGQGDSDSGSSSISSDGRYVAFTSNAHDLVPGDTNIIKDIFVHDTATGATTRVSVASDSSQSNGYSDWCTISPDGFFVTFGSFGTNLVPGDTNGEPDIFLHNTTTGATTRVNVSTRGAQANDGASYSAPGLFGQYVVFASFATNLVSGDTNDNEDIFVHDTQTGVTSRVSVSSAARQGNRDSAHPAITPDGQFVVFDSGATHLVRNDTNGAIDTFVHRRWGAAHLRADLWIQRAVWVGDNVYNTTGDGQKVARTIAPTGEARYVLRIQNDGDTRDRFLIQGLGSTAKWQVRYFNQPTGGDEITGQVTGSGWLTPELDPTALRGFRVVVTPKPAANTGDDITRLVTATSWGDERKLDVAKTVTTLGTSSTGVTVSALSSAPTAQGAQVTFRLSEAAAVDARILNIAGRRLRTLCQARPCDEGANTLLWDARADTGLRVPAGAYLVEVVSRAEDGSQSRAVTTVRLTR